MARFPKLNLKALKEVKPFEGILLLVLILYLLYRPLLTATGVGFLLVLTLARTIFSLFPLNFSAIKQRFKLKPFLFFAAIIYVGLSAFNYRGSSSDALTFSYKTAYFIKENPVLNFLNPPPKPFLFEYLYGQMWKFLDLNFLNLLMGFIGLAAIYSSYKLLKVIRPDADKKTILLYLLLTCVNPVFLSLLLFQFKPDLLAYTLTCFIFINYIHFLKEKALKNLYWVGILAGAVLITKVPYFIVIIPILVLCVFYLFKNFRLGISIKHAFLFGFLSLTPFIIWATMFGFTIPKFESALSFRGYVQSNTLQLPYDPVKFEMCNQERVVYDYAALIESPTNPYSKILQPWFYITRDIYKSEDPVSLGEPGIFIYIGIILFSLFKMGDFKKNPTMIWTSIPLLAALILYYFTVANAFWYVLFAFPFFATSFLDFAKSHMREISYKLLLKAIFIYSTVIVAFALGTWCYSLVFKWGDLIQEGIFKNNAGLNSLVIEKYTEDKFVFDATIHPHFIYYPFAKTSYSKVYVNPYYFASTNMTNIEMKNTLLTNNIEYIVVIKSQLKDPKWYSGCLLENNEKLESFLNEHTESVFIPRTKESYLYKIKI